MELTRMQEYRHPGHQRQDLVDTQVRMINEAPILIIVSGDPRKFQATVLAHQFFSGEWDIFHMNLANAATLINLAAASLGLGSAWQTIDRPTEHELKELLGIPIYYRMYVQIPVGYPAVVPPATYRHPLNDLVHIDGYDKSKFQTNEQVREWLAMLRQGSLPSYDVRKRPAK